MAVDETPSNDAVPEQPMPPEQMPGAIGTPPPTPFSDLPRPPRRGDAGGAIPFDPMGHLTLQSLAEVDPKKPAVAEGVVTKAQIDAAKRKVTFVPKFPTLERMYAEYPLLHKQGALRVERVHPQWEVSQYGEKVRVCGVLSWRHPIISSQDFTHVFGGFRYRVFGLLDQEDPNNAGGPPQPVEIAVAEFEVPVPPNLENLPISEAETGADQGPPPPFPMQPGMMPMMQQPATPYGRRAGMYQPQYPPGYYMPQQPSADPFAPAFNFATRLFERQPPAAPPVSDAMWNLLGKQSETSVEGVRFMAEQNARAYEAQLAGMRHEMQAMREAAMSNADKPTDVVQMVSAMSQLVSAQKGGADSDLVRQMRDDHERALRHEKEEHEREVKALRDDTERTLLRLREESDRATARDKQLADDRIRLAESAPPTWTTN